MNVGRVNLSDPQTSHRVEASRATLELSHCTKLLMHKPSGMGKYDWTKTQTLKDLSYYQLLTNHQGYNIRNRGRSLFLSSLHYGTPLG